MSNAKRVKRKSRPKGQLFLVRRKGLEPPTYWFVASHSIQLSYSRIPKRDISPNSLVIIAPFLLNCKSFLLTMGAGIAVGALGAMMLPKNSEVYQFTNDAASTIKQEAEKAIQSMTN